MKITARVFPNLHKEVILGMPWLIQENLAIDWARGQVQIQRQGNVLQLPIHRYEAKTADIEMVNVSGTYDHRIPPMDPLSYLYRKRTEASGFASITDG